MDALILAGSSNKGELNQETNVKDEAMIRIGKKTMVEYVVDAVSGSRRFDNIILVGPVKELQKLFASREDIIMVDGGKTVIQGVLNGLKHLNKDEMLLVATSDIPLLTEKAVNNFVDSCQELKGDIFYPIVPKKVTEEKLPESKRTYFTLKEGTFTGGNLFFVDPKIIPDCAAKAEDAVKLRKSPLKLAGMLGVPFIIKFLLKRLSIREVEERASKILGYRAKGIISQYPEVGMDVDKLSDLELVKRYLRKD
ncbi:molybdopterin-guanine dinucleotide biosynthesis protein A [Desulfitispora alkaliphila]|uniref:nucleotidyltransferase family protein n=1 Tax=Desulfitispora alkaliphila TaxID=622674 RepID=UPI003D231303